MGQRRIDRQAVLKALEECDGNAAEVARRTGIHQNTARQIARLAQRECVRCRQPVFPGRTMCQSCLNIDRQRVKSVRRQRRAAGLCLQCGAPRMDGSQFCEPHRGMAMERQRRYETKKKVLHGSPQGGAPDNRQRRLNIRSKYGEGGWQRWQAANGQCEVCAAGPDQCAIHLHHIDEDQSNNAFENFACLCFACHRAVHLLLSSQDRMALIVWFERTYPGHPLVTRG